MALTIPLFRGWIGRNNIYGIRFSQSLQSDDAWYAINRYGGGKRLLPVVLVGIVILFLPLQPHPRLAILTGFSPLALFLAPALQAWHYARHYRSRE